MILHHIRALNSRKVVLASASPRRKEILANLGLNVQVIKSDFEENLSKVGLSAAEYAIATARGKCADVAAKVPDADLIIAADTVVECDGAVLEKAVDAEHARHMLQQLSGCMHKVHTGVALSAPQAQGPAWESAFSDTTDVVFARLSVAEIQAYIDTGECFGKAGAYGIQGPAGAWVQALRGSYHNVMGFPVHAFAARLSSAIKDGRLLL